MKNFDASEETSTPLHCLVCEREIPDGNWFARIKLGNRRVAFCRPWCIETYLDGPERYVWRLETSLAASKFGDRDLQREWLGERSETQKSDAWVIPGISSIGRLSGARSPA